MLFVATSKTLAVKLSLYWCRLPRYCARLCLRYHAVYTYLGPDITQGGQGKYYSDCRMSLSPTVSLTNVANVNYPLSCVYIGKV
jgi:hypothetical protein